jgi:hypothetical protein
MLGVIYRAIRLEINHSYWMECSVRVSPGAPVILRLLVVLFSFAGWMPEY